MPLGAGGRAARGEPAVLQHLRPGLLGVHALRRRARHVQERRSSSRASRSRRGSPTRSTASCRRRSTRPTTSSTGGSSTRGSRPGRWTTPKPRMRDALPPARRGRRADGRLRLRHRVRAALPHRGVPERDRHRPRRRRPLRAVGRGLLRRLRRRPGRARARWPRRSQGIREYWVAALEERRGEPEPRPGDLASHLLHATYDDRPLTDAEMLDMLTVLVLAGLDTTRAELGYMFRHLAAHPEHRRRARSTSRS